MKYEEEIPIEEMQHLQETTVEQQKTEDYNPKTKFLGVPLAWFAVIVAFTTKKNDSLPPRLLDGKGGKLRN
jgi:hypothetical protein